MVNISGLWDFVISVFWHFFWSLAAVCWRTFTNEASEITHGFDDFLLLDSDIRGIIYSGFSTVNQKKKSGIAAPCTSLGFSRYWSQWHFQHEIRDERRPHCFSPDVCQGLGGRWPRPHHAPGPHLSPDELLPIWSSKMHRFNSKSRFRLGVFTVVRGMDYTLPLVRKWLKVDFCCSWSLVWYVGVKSLLQTEVEHSHSWIRCEADTT
jgi:hypothetical protein